MMSENKTSVGNSAGKSAAGKSAAGKSAAGKSAVAEGGKRATRAGGAGGRVKADAKQKVGAAASRAGAAGAGATAARAGARAGATTARAVAGAAKAGMGVGASAGAKAAEAAKAGAAAAKAGAEAVKVGAEAAVSSALTPMRRKYLLRLWYVLLLLGCAAIAVIVLMAVVVAQFGFVFLSGKQNSQLLELGGGVSRYLYEAMLFITFRSEEKPFPFSPWPSGE